MFPIAYNALDAQKIGWMDLISPLVNLSPSATSRIYRRPAHLHASWKALYSMVSPPTFTRDGVILPMEGDLWQVTVMSMAKDYPPMAGA